MRYFLLLLFALNGFFPFAQAIEPVALTLLPVYSHKPDRRLNILTLGDSNGALDYGWPQQLRNEAPCSNIINISRSGKTIGFDNNNDTILNQLKTLDYDLNKANQRIGSLRFDFIIIGLGTNDAKAIFDKQQKAVPANLELIIKQIKNSKYPSINSAKIIIVSPPPYGKESQIQQKYSGGLKRVEKMSQTFRKVAQVNDCLFIDTFTPLLHYIDALSKDGIHMNATGQRKVACLIVKELR